ncbi:MAG: YraN family protein [Lachnospiraceae bacterium]|nr:YraN family protein [Lachnospiraceae bacterium]
MNKRAVGSFYEEQAAKYLEEKGYRILERNFHAGKIGEIDIIAKSADGYLTFIECKYRENTEKGDPLDTIDYRKQRQICKAALYYMKRKGFSLETPCRFDVIAYYGDGAMHHITDAFSFFL